MLHQRDFFGYDNTSRVFDFSSYAFDAAWVTFTYALSGGACLCIPSESERKDGLAETMKRLEVTHADLTPSIASALPVSAIKSLRALILGGEQLRVEDAHRWGE